MQKIIDFHNHIFPENISDKATGFLGDYYHVPIECTGTIDVLIEDAKKAGIETLVVHSTATKASQVETINSYIAAACKEHKNFIGFGSLHPDMANPAEEIERIISLGLRGIKLHPDFQNFPADSDKMMPIYEKLSGRLPVLFHAGDIVNTYSSPKRIARVHDAFPNLTIIAAHLGGYRRWEEALEYLSGTDVYFDTSSSLWALTKEKAEFYIKSHNINRILYGTDFPMSGHESELKRFYSIDLTDEERELILYKNAAELLNL